MAKSTPAATLLTGKEEFPGTDHAEKKKIGGHCLIKTGEVRHGGTRRRNPKQNMTRQPWNEMEDHKPKPERGADEG